MKQFLFVLILILVNVCSFAQSEDSLIYSIISEDIAQQENKPQVQPQGKTYFLDTVSYTYPFVDSLICYAKSYLGSPYQYGSKGPRAFDCSGFIGYVFSHFGITLPSSSSAQYVAAPRKFKMDSATPGDLIFFAGRSGRHSVGHVGMVVNVDTVNHSCRFIHAATHGGVILTDYPSTAYYNTRLVGFGRYVYPTILQAEPQKSSSDMIDIMLDGEDANKVEPE